MTSFGFFIELKSFKIPLSPLEFRKQQKDTFGSKDYLNKYLLSGHKVPKYRRIYQSKMYKLYIITTWTAQGQLDYIPVLLIVISKLFTNRVLIRFPNVSVTSTTLIKFRGIDLISPASS